MFITFMELSEQLKIDFTCMIASGNCGIVLAAWIDFKQLKTSKRKDNAECIEPVTWTNTAVCKFIGSPHCFCFDLMCM